MKKFFLLLIFVSALSPFNMQGSLYKISSSPYASNIAQSVGDTLTIVVAELTTTSDQGTANEQKRYDSFEFLLEKFFFPKFGITDGFGNLPDPDGPSPGFNGSIKKEYKADAQRSSTQSVDTTIQARVIEVVNEDQFLIRGHRDLSINGKYTRLFVSGVIRKKDIDSTNSISSSLIADAVLEVNGEVVTEDLAPGIIEKFLDLFF